MKKFILGIVLGIALTGSIVGVVAYNYNAKDIGYTPNDSNWNVKTVEEALGYLYKNHANGNMVVDNLEKLSDGVTFDDDYYMIYTPGNYSWNEANVDNANYEKIIFCHKASGHNKNFTATLPFSIDGKTLNVVPIKIIGDNGWNPTTRLSSGNILNVDVNYGVPETDEYYFYVGVK